MIESLALLMYIYSTDAAINQDMERELMSKQTIIHTEFIGGGGSDPDNPDTGPKDNPKKTGDN